MRNLRNSLFGLFALVALASCSTVFVQPKTPAQAVYQAQGDYIAALSVQIKYNKLPRCGTVPPLSLCRDPDVERTVRQLDDIAFAAISSAQAAVRTPGFGEDKLATAVATATNATSAFSSIVNTLRVK